MKETEKRKKEFQVERKEKKERKKTYLKSN